MSNGSEVSIWYQQLLAQLAADSYLHDIDFREDSDALEAALRQGANHPNHYGRLKEDGRLSATQMPGGGFSGFDGMVNDFNATWQIIDHLPNKSSGFSATLLKKINPEQGEPEYTLSFRSTESKSVSDGGDVERDSSNGANGQIGNLGFAWAQMADMEAYFEDLMQGNLAHPGADQDVKDAVAAYFSDPNKTFNMTGYSLGSHLAQVFTLMHPDRVNHAYTFNGAGMGAIRGKDGVKAPRYELIDRLSYYRAIWMIR